MIEEKRMRLYGSVLAVAMKHWEEQGYRISEGPYWFVVRNDKVCCKVDFLMFKLKFLSYEVATDSDNSLDKIDEFNVMDVDNPAHKIFETVNEHLDYWQKGGDTA